MARSIALLCPVTGRSVRWFSSSDKVSPAIAQGEPNDAWAAMCPACGQVHLVNVETANLAGGEHVPSTAGFVQGMRR